MTSSSKDTTTSPSSSDQPPPRPPHPFLHATLLSKLLFIWPNTFMNKTHSDGSSSILQECDLPEVLPNDSSQKNLNDFRTMWEKEKQRAATAMERHRRTHGDKTVGSRVPPPPSAHPSLRRAYAMDFLTSLWFVQPIMGLAALCRMVQAVALGYLLQSFEVQDVEGGYLWAGVMVASGFVVLMEHHHVMQYRISAIAAIYDKSLRLSSTSNIELLSSKKGKDKTSTSTSGKIVNIATNDVERFLMATLFASHILWAPLQSVAILGVGWFVIGWSFAAGFGLLIFVFVPMQFHLSKKFAILRGKIARITDERVTQVSQAVSGVRVMKMAGWEENFEERVASIRSAEVGQIERVNRYRALNEAIFYFCNVATSVVIFIIHVAHGGLLTPRTVFTTMVLINIAQLEITKHFSLGVMGVSECYVSIGRIQKFLESPELENDIEMLEEEEESQCAIRVYNVTCHWNTPRAESVSTIEDADEPRSTSGLAIALDKVNITFDLGQLTCIIGEVGSGKSAFIQMLAGELPPSTGTIQRKRDSTIAYAPQDPWIMDGTVRENILLGRPFDADFYDSIVNACGLNVDFAQLRDGEDTIVGDRGVQLSGGQRARIALARAFYRDADILLLDDPLSAVDSKVGRLLFYSAIQDLGLKRGKCVVLVTHQHQFIGDSRCVMMSAGGVACIGSYRQCVEESRGKLTLAFQNKQSFAEDAPANDAAPQDITVAFESKRAASSGDESLQTDESARSATKNVSEHKEISQTGIVKRETFLNYLKAMPGGLWTGFFMLILFIATQGSVLATIAAIGMWSGLPAEDQASRGIIGIVVGLVLVVCFLAILRAFSSFYFTVEASKRLHDQMTKSVLRSKIEFFDTNPIGRILNRFSADVGSNDDQLPSTLFDFLVVFFMVLGALISAVSVIPITLVFVPPMMWYFVRVRGAFVSTSRELKRMEGLARSPIFAMLSESLSGIATIRSNNALEYFQHKFRVVHDAHARAFFAFISCSRWLGFRMDSLMFIFLSIATFAAVIVQDQKWLNIDPGILGLALSLLIQLAGLFQWCIRQSAEVVNQMVAVERVIGFRDLPSEAPLVNDFDKTVSDWPSTGEIDVQSLSVRYRSGLPLSLQGLTFRIEGGSRVGVVGRTGGGKSTLVQSLLRLLEAENGQILVDGVDISKMGLHKLRRGISVIPQSPILYGGCTLRDNLDPFHNHNDEEITKALESVHMLEAVSSLPLALDTVMADGGLNFSVGQRQLLCLARAILRKNRILVLDEPTANVDSRTDKLLQEAVAHSFQGATIIAVAHRLDTVIDYDKILVLGNGSVLEYGSPHELIQKVALLPVWLVTRVTKCQVF
eukprot:CCRYP_020942-RD/>CCRYP_020942-RD protein AED:0.33 eAED:0.33 QI:0/0.9/0.90/1/0.9/0.90/11/87/1336